MDNILRKTIRDEVNAVLSARNSPAAPSTSTEAESDNQPITSSKKREQRLGSLLKKIRSNKTASSQKKKLRKLHVKYERYEDESEHYISVKAKEGGGSRFIEANTSEPLTFLDLKWKTVGLFFDNQDCNFFGENSVECFTQLVTLTGEELLTNESVWDYFKRKGLCPSKSVFILRSAIPTDDNLNDINTTLTVAEDRNVDITTTSKKRKICPLCGHTYECEECFFCQQDLEFTLPAFNPSTSFGDFNEPIMEQPRFIFENSDNITTDPVQRVFKVHRLKIKEDLIKEFKNESISMEDDIRFTIIDGRGIAELGVGDGVSRDVYSLFWQEVCDSYLIGAEQRVPFVRHDLYVNEWVAIAKILVKGFIDTGYFPITLNKAFIKFCLFFETDNDLIENFLLYCNKDERDLIKVALESEDPAELLSSSEFMDILEDYKCRSLVTANNLREIIIELAKQELFQKPHVMASCWQPILCQLKSKITSSAQLDELYSKLYPTNKKVIDILECNPTTDPERDSFHFFKRFVKSLDVTDLKRLLSFLTGSELLVVEKIEITFFKEMSLLSRRPFAHTCGPMLELPCTYNNLCELREEFANILKCSTWEMDII